MKEAQDRHMAEQGVAGNVRQGGNIRDKHKLRQAKSRQKRLDERMDLEVNAKGGRFRLSRDLVRDVIEISKGEDE